MTWTDLANARLLRTSVALAALAGMLSCSSCANPSDETLAEESLPPMFADADSGEGVFSSSVDLAEAAAEIADPNAEPQTALGRLRARYFPKWSSDLDWAFPPDVCESPWELDAIAVGVSYADSRVLGDVHRAAALAVMRYELFTSRAMFEPSALSQICLSTVSLPPARTTNLAVLASYIDSGARRVETPSHPSSVEIIAVAPSAVLAAACVKPGYATVLSADSVVVSEPQAPVRLQTYLLTLASGQEDEVADVTLRVARLFHRPADGCEELVEWLGEWRLRVEAWIAEGRLWNAADAVITQEELCSGEHKVEDCPRNWM